MAQSSTTAIPHGQKRRKLDSGNKLPQFVCAIIISIGAVISGTVLAWTSPGLKHLEWPNSTAPIYISSKTELSWIAAWTPIGAIFGGVPAGFLADFFGRRTSLMIITVPWFIMWLIISFTSISLLLHMARFISGFVIGVLFGIVPLYITEISEASVRGSFGIFFQLFVTIGIMLEYILGIFNFYPLLSLVGALLTVLYFILLYCIPESPILLMSKKRRDEALQSLKSLRGPTYNVELELQKIERELRSLHQAALSTSSESSSVLTKGNVKALIISIILMISQQATGINAVIFYSEKLLKKSHVSDPAAYTAFIGLFSILATVLTSFLIDRLGRRILLIISHLGTAICSAIFSYYLVLLETIDDVSHISWLSVATLCTFMIMFALGAGPIPWVVAAEMLTPEIKKFGIGAVVATSWGAAAFITFFFKPLSTRIGTEYVFVLFSLLSFISAIFIFLVLPETKGKSIDEIRVALGDIVADDDDDDDADTPKPKMNVK